MLEELGEAALFEAWLGGPRTTEGVHVPGRVLLLRGSEALLGEHLQPAEYLGAICDLVGEIGRFAVRRATERDAEQAPKSDPKPSPSLTPTPALGLSLNPKPSPKPS